MKVVIGPYLNWWGPYQIFGLLNHVGVSEETTHRWAKNSPGWFHNLCQWVNDRRKRKQSIKIDDYDVWGMDTTLATIILPMLVRLKEKKHGAPMCSPYADQSSNSAQFSFDFYQDGDEAAWEANQKAWDDILDEMIWTFTQLQPDHDWEDQYWRVHPELDLSDYPEDEGKTVVPVRWKVNGDCDWEGMRKHQERINAGLKLFGEWYQALWD